MKPYCLLLIALFALTSCNTVMYDDGIKNAYRYAAQSTVKKQLTNPASARFGEMDVYRDKNDKITICGTVDSKNSKGTDTGDVWFISDGSKAVLSDQINKKDFNAKWKNLCTKLQPGNN